jgi:predicted XRE-type DNA-binding protein
MSHPKKVTASSGNVFADLGFGNPEEELLKAKLVREIRGIIKRRKLTQTKAAAMLGLKQPDVSALVTGRVRKFSIDRLVRCLHRMDYKVDVVVRHKAVGIERRNGGSDDSRRIAELGRSNVMLILKDGTEVFSDFSGIIQHRFTTNVSERFIDIQRDLKGAKIIA